MSVAFLLTTLVVVATPGAGALFTIGAGLGRGRRASLVAAVGCTIGIVPHLVAAATGLAALMHASALAFQGLKYAGVAYLLFLAWTTLRDKGALGVDAAEPSSAWRTIRQAVLLNLLNPKLTIFFVAFLPQFVHPDEPNALWHMLGLSAVFMLVTLVVFAGYGVFAAAMRTRVLARPRVPGVAASLVRRVLRPPRRTAGGDGPMTVEVTYEGVLAAADAIAPHLPPTPAWSYPLLDQTAGVTVVVKHENVQPTGAFKVRGGINLALALNADEREAGLVTASTGNHAQSVCYGARLVGATAVIVVPESAPPSKVAAVRALGGEVVMHGPTMDEAVEEAKRLAGERGLRYVDPGNEPAIVHGHATVYLELLQRHPELEAIYVPVGSGTGASGACVVREVLAPTCRVIAVQSSAAPAAHTAWQDGRPAQAPCRTRSSGLATGTSYALPQRVMAGRLDDFVLVSDDDLDAAAGLLASHAHTLAETAGAAALAALLADPDRPQRCAVIVTGGNASADEIRAVASRVGDGTTHP